MSVDISQLQEMMSLDADAVRRLKVLLVQERQLLEQRQHDSLQQLVEQKTLLLDQLGRHAQMRHKLLQLLGLPVNATGWDSFLHRNAHTVPLREGWRNIIEEFSECQRLNEINGKMIARSRQTLNHLLNLLRGQVGAPSLYNAYGNATQQHTSYTVAKA